MPRPTSKQELLTQSHARYEALNTFIDAMAAGDRERTFKPGTMNRNIRDVLGHVHHWHLLFLEWYAVGMKGGKPEMPAKGYTWSTSPALNRWIHERYSGHSLKRMRSALARSHTKLMAVIGQHSQAELFTRKRYAWTGSTSLGAYMVSATSSHYDWALKLIKRGLA